MGYPSSMFGDYGMEWNGLEVIYRSLYRVLGPHFPGQPFTRVPRWPIIGHLYPRQWPPRCNYD